jgi:hypothetical protein
MKVCFTFCCVSAVVSKITKTTIRWLSRTKKTCADSDLNNNLYQCLNPSQKPYILTKKCSSTLDDVSLQNVIAQPFFFRTPFYRARSLSAELFLYWPVSRCAGWVDCFYTGPSPDVQNPHGIKLAEPSLPDTCEMHLIGEGGLSMTLVAGHRITTCGTCKHPRRSIRWHDMATYIYSFKKAHLPKTKLNCVEEALGQPNLNLSPPTNNYFTLGGTNLS